MIMKTKLFPALFLAAGFLALGASAQTPAPSPVPVADAPASLAPSRFIYAPRLPTPSELTSVATAQGLGIEKIDQTASQITVTYKSANGQLSVVAYLLLSAAGSSVATPVATVVTPTPAPVVVYQGPEPVYYRYDPYYYYPWDVYAPLAIGIGLGIGLHDYHSYHGGFYYGGRGHGHGRW